MTTREGPTARDFSDHATGFRGWRIQLQQGRAIPTPAFHDGTLYVGGGFGSYDYYAIDARSGRIKWHYRTPDDGPTAGVITDGHLCYNTESCTLEVLSPEGRPIWKRWLGDPLLGHPAAHAGRVFAVYPRHGTHFLGAFSLGDGDPLWETPLGGDVITAPVALGDEVYLSTTDGHVQCVAATTGFLKWSEDMHATSAPWVHEGRVFVAHREAPADPKRPESPKERTSEFRADSGKSTASYSEKPAPYLDLKWGSDRKERLGGVADAGVGFGVAPGAAKLHQTAALFGEVKVSRAWRYQGSRPVFWGGMVFDSTGDHLDARDAETGRPAWSWKAPAGISGERCMTPPAVARGTVWAGTWDCHLMSWDARSGNVCWQALVGAPCHWQPITGEGWIYAGLEDGSLVGLDTGDSGDTGWPMWGGGPGHNGSETESAKVSPVEEVIA